MTPLRVMLEYVRRLASLARRPRADADLEEELRLHVDLAAEEQRRRGDAPADAVRAARLRAGGVVQALDALRDQRGLPSADALAADLIFGWRQIVRNPTASLSAVLSLGLAIGSSMAAFRLVDAVLLRPLPVADPSSLFAITTTVHDVDNRPDDRDDSDYPTYRRYVSAAGAQADLMVIGFAARLPIRIGGDEPEAAILQFVSGNVFATLGLQPALGRLLGASDDVVPDGHPVAVISHDFWQRRFAGDAGVIGRTFRMGDRAIEIVGVAPSGFTGTEPGIVTDLFMPAMMNPQALNSPGWSWFRIWVRPKPGVLPAQVHALLEARFTADHHERVKKFPADTAKSRIDAFLAERLRLEPAGSGVSRMQKSFRRPLWILAALAVLLLLIACANVANLLLARAMTRGMEMALRISIGAGRGRLIQLMLVESALLGLQASAVGALFAWWAAPFVVSMLAPAERPVRLMLAFDWRTFASGAALTLMVTLLFGVAPALRASAVRPAGALKDARDQRGQRRVSGVLVAAQMAFCVILLFGASLFVATFQRLQHKPLGFAPGNVVHMVVESRATLGPEVWRQLAAQLREIPRVESVAVAGWAPLTGNRWRSSITVAGRPPQDSAPNWVAVSPGYFETMRTPMIEGREFGPADAPPPPDARHRSNAGVAIVNQAFARTYFDGRSPVGQRVIVDSAASSVEIVGMAGDAVYVNVREAIHPAVFIPLAARDGATLLVRTAGDAADLRAVLRREVSRIRPDVRVREVEPFDAIVTQQTQRERLLAALSAFFATLALLLAAIGMYGVLNYAVTRERREIGLRMALGAGPGHVLTLITTRFLGAVCIGAVAGAGGALALGGAVRTLLFEIEPGDPIALAAPILTLAAVAALAAVPPAIRAVRIDPAETLKVEG